jgi:hypothetical protein
MFALLDTVLLKVGEFCSVEVPLLSVGPFTSIFNVPPSFLHETNLLPVPIFLKNEAVTTCIVSPSDLSKKIDALFDCG